MDITAPQFTDEDAARAHMEALRWRNGVTCPHCGVDTVKKLEGAKHRKGVYQCNGCREQFTVTVGTVFERSKVPLHKWVLATHLLTASKKGMSAHQLHRMLGVTYKTAWFMAHRIREAMTSTDTTPMGGNGGEIAVDETYIGRVKGKDVARAGHHKMKVVSLVERRTGIARSYVVDVVSKENVAAIIARNCNPQSRLMTDEASVYKTIGRDFITHDAVNHGKGEYVRGDRHTNTIEGYFSIFKRGMRGIYQHCAEHHLQRYLAEFDFRYTNRAALGVDDADRAALAIIGAEGKRLTYRRTGGERAYAA